MKMLDHASQELIKLWHEDTDHDVDLNALLTRLYPFSDSFDQVQLNIREWLRDYNQKIVNMMDDVNTVKCHIHEDFDPDCLICNPIKKTSPFTHPNDFKPNGGTIEGLFDVDAEDLQDDEVVFFDDYNKLMQAYNTLYYYALPAKEKKDQYYLVEVHNDVDPVIHGPYNTELERDGAAIEKRLRDPEQLNGLYMLNLDPTPRIFAYSGAFFELPKDSSGLTCNFLNYYKCTTCGHEWVDRWSCGCDDECDQCDTVMTPLESVEIEIPEDYE